MRAVIMAGGKGTRIAQVDSTVPKPMIPVLGKPILERQVEILRQQGFSDITLVTGHLGHVIEGYFRDGSRFGVHIDYLSEKTPLGTAGALFYLRGKLKEDFLLLCGDLVFDVDLMRFYRAHRAYGGLATLLTHPNSHPQDSAVIITDECGKVTGWLHKEEERGWYKNRVNAGLHFLSPGILERFSEAKKTDLDREILKPLIASESLFAYDSPEYVLDMGTPERYLEAQEDLRLGIVERKNLGRPQKAIFLDRDGTVNQNVGFLRHIDEFKLCEGAAKAIAKINKNGYLAIVISNQPVIARGELSLKELDEIHRKMETLLGRENAYLDAIYFCPHHPDRGFAGERAEYKVPCDCRKPKAGMLYRAAEKFNIDLSQSWMIGDAQTDVSCGINGGCKTAIIGSDARADVCGADLNDCVNQISEREKWTIL